MFQRGLILPNYVSTRTFQLCVNRLIEYNSKLFDFTSGQQFKQLENPGPLTTPSPRARTSQTECSQLCVVRLPIGGRSYHSVSLFKDKDRNSVTKLGPKSDVGLYCVGRRWKQKGRNRQNEDDDSDSEDEESDQNEEELGGVEFEEDRDFPSNYKQLKTHVKTVRVDAIASAGLNIARNKIEEYFLSGVIRVDGEKVKKKHTRVEPGSYIDLITSMQDGEARVKRVRVLNVSEALSQSGRIAVHLRAWRSNVNVGDLYSKKNKV